jgi:hypothetical protein
MRWRVMKLALKWRIVVACLGLSILVLANVIIVQNEGYLSWPLSSSQMVMAVRRKCEQDEPGVDKNGEITMKSESINCPIPDMVTVRGTDGREFKLPLEVHGVKEPHLEIIDHSQNEMQAWLNEFTVSLSEE